MSRKRHMHVFIQLSPLFSIWILLIFKSNLPRNDYCTNLISCCLISGKLSVTPRVQHTVVQKQGHANNGHRVYFTVGATRPRSISNELPSGCTLNKTPSWLWTLRKPKSSTPTTVAFWVDSRGPTTVISASLQTNKLCWFNLYITKHCPLHSANTVHLLS
jgi:hypothetical protein